MREDEAIDLVRSVICQMRKAEPSQIAADADLADTLGFDSLDAAEVLAALHNKTGIELQIDSGEDLRSVAGIARRLAGAVVQG